MTATEFIKSNLYKFISEFPHAKVSYEHEIICNTHYIQIEPSSLYNDDTDYINWEERTTLDFIDKYSSENICFVTNDSIVTITNSEFELIGNQYLNYFFSNLEPLYKSYFNFNESFNLNSSLLNMGNHIRNYSQIEYSGIGTIRMNYLPSCNTSFNLEGISNSLIDEDILNMQLNLQEKEYLSFENDLLTWDQILNKNQKMEDTSLIKIGETSFAMAA